MQGVETWALVELHQREVEGLLEGEGAFWGSGNP